MDTKTDYREDDELWKLIGDLPEPSVPKHFTQRVLQSIASIPQELPAPKRVLTFRTWHTLAAVAAVIALICVLRPVIHSSSEDLGSESRPTMISLTREEIFRPTPAGAPSSRNAEQLAPAPLLHADVSEAQPEMSRVPDGISEYVSIGKINALFGGDSSVLNDDQLSALLF